MVVHADKLRWLFWLRWKTFLRNYTHGAGRVSRIIGLVFLLLFGIPFMGAIAVGTYFAYRLLPMPANGELLALVLTGIFVLWIVLPLLEFTANEGLDISKLSLFPLSRAELMLSLIFTSLLDIPTIGLLLVFGAVVVGWAYSLPLTLMVLLTMVVFYAQVVGMSQLVLALLSRILQSRRFRDLSIILIGIFSSSCYLFQRLVFSGIGASNIDKTLMNGSVSPKVQWLPPGMAARAIQQAAQGNWGASFIWFAFLLISTVIVLYLWQLVVERGLTASEGASDVVRRHKVERGHEAAGPALASNGLLTRIANSQSFTIALKDLKYYRRDPLLLRLIFQTFISMIVLVAVTIFNPANAGTTGWASSKWIVIISPLYALFAITTFSYNVLGMERQSLTSLFLFPLKPRQVLWGKNIVTFLIGFVEVFLLVCIAAYVSKAWFLVIPALAIGIAGIGIILACGNFSSIFFPQRMLNRQRGFQTTSSTSSEGGCLRILMSFAVLAVMAVLLLPAAAALVLPVLYNNLWIWWLSVPGSLLYGALLYTLVTNAVAPRMLTREPEILAIVTRE